MSLKFTHLFYFRYVCIKKNTFLLVSIRIIQRYKVILSCDVKNNNICTHVYHYDSKHKNWIEFGQNVVTSGAAVAIDTFQVCNFLECRILVTLFNGSSNSTILPVDGSKVCTYVMRILLYCLMCSEDFL